MTAKAEATRQERLSGVWAVHLARTADDFRHRMATGCERRPQRSEPSRFCWNFSEVSGSAGEHANSHLCTFRRARACSGRATAEGCVSADLSGPMEQGFV